MLQYKGATALITGASGGMGEAFAEQLSERGCNLVVVARSTDKLQTLAWRLKQQNKVEITIIGADLGSSAEVERLVQEVKKRNIHIDLLINNAGFGIFEPFLELPLDRQMAQIDLNVRALVALTYAFAPGMVAKAKGGVINLSSSAGFQPVAGANIYAASKSFVLFFSEALAQEISSTGVHVLAVCPGPVATQFFAEMKPTIGRNQMDDPRVVVRQALEAFDRGKRVLVPGKLAVRMDAFAVRFLPRAIVARLAEQKTKTLNQRQFVKS